MAPLGRKRIGFSTTSVIPRLVRGIHSARDEPVIRNGDAAGPSGPTGVNGSPDKPGDDE
jgi:hypothetical protein